MAAGARLTHGYPSWDWRELTFRAVAKNSGVSESTVFRHFANERELHGAVLERLQADAGVTYEGIRLEEVADVAERVFATLSSFAAGPIGPQVDDPTLVTVGRERREALHAAVAAAAPHLSPVEVESAAGALDVLWSPVAYQHLVAEWRLTDEQAIAAIKRAIAAVVATIRQPQLGAQGPPSVIPSPPGADSLEE